MAKQIMQKNILVFALLAILALSPKYLWASDSQHSVQGPVPDVLRLVGTGESAAEALGLLDVTQAPYNADPTGTEDATKALQMAIEYARDNQLIVFFPSGTYLVSDTLVCKQLPYDHTRRRISGAQFFPVALVGSYSGSRPRLVLAPSSPGFQDRSRPKHVIRFETVGADLKSDSPSMGYNQVFRNIDIEISSDNSGAVGLWHRGAQGTAVQDTSIFVNDGYIGFEGGLGSGGGMGNVTVVGGDYGLYMKETQPTPTLVDVRLRKQRRNALVYGGRQSLSAVGLDIIMDGVGPAILGEPNHASAHYGEMAIVDSKIVFLGGAGVAVQSPRNVYLEDVYVRNAAVVAAVNGKSVSAPSADWVHVEELALKGAPPREWLNGYVFKPEIFIAGTRATSVEIIHFGHPPANLIESHRWGNLPSFESSEVVNVKLPPYNAKGDGVADDTLPLQKAIREHNTVFLPKGIYKISQTIQLEDDTTLFGLAKHLSLLYFRPGEGATDPFAAISTGSKAIGATRLFDFGILIDSGRNNLYSIDWRASKDSVMKDLGLYFAASGHSRKKGMPVTGNVVVRNGGGRWYNFFDMHYSKRKNYSHLAIIDNDRPLSIYQCNVEHVANGPAMSVVRSRKLDIYGLKAETLAPYELPAPIFSASHSSDFNVYGYGGKSVAARKDSLFRLVDCERYRLVNLVDTPPKPKKSRPGVNEWCMVIELSGGSTIKTRPLERPLLYKR